MQIDLNADLGEGFGPWAMGADDAMLQLVSSANIACGGHASDPETMFTTLGLAKAQGVTVGAHPGYADPLGFGRRIIPMSIPQIEQMVAAQIGSLMGVAALAGVRMGYVKAHGALANLAAENRDVADAVVRAVRAVSRDLAYLAISGTCQHEAGLAAGLQTFAEVFADRAYQPNGRLVPRSHPLAMIHDPVAAAARMLEFVQTGMMPVLNGPAIPLQAQSVCVHGDSPGAVAMAQHVATALRGAGIGIKAFLT